MSDSVVVRTRDLGRRFGRNWALSHVNLEIETGTVCLIAGANGSGKTTLLRIVAGISRPSEGSVTIEERDPRSQRSAYRRSVGFLTHHDFLYGGLTAAEMLRTWSSLLGRRDPSSELAGLLADVGLSYAADIRVDGFSALLQRN